MPLIGRADERSSRLPVVLGLHVRLELLDGWDERGHRAWRPVLLLDPREVNNGDLIAALNDDVIVRQRPSNYAPRLAVKRVARSYLAA